MPRIDWSRVANYPVACPSENEQLKICSVLDNWTELHDRLNKKLGKYLSLRNGLLQDLLSGRVRVPEEMIGALAKKETEISVSEI